MFGNDFRKRTAFFIFSIAVIILILIIIPNETTLHDYQMNYLGLKEVDGKLYNIGNNMPASQVSETSIGLLLNFYHFVKIILWMAVIIIFVRYVNFLIFHVALRSTSQNEISSLIRTILSVIVCIVAFFIIFQSQYPTVQLAPLF